MFTAPRRPETAGGQGCSTAPFLLVPLIHDAAASNAARESGNADRPGNRACGIAPVGREPGKRGR
jgi:hypothetical protein